MFRYALLSVVAINFHLACHTDPGFITKSNYEKYNHYKHDGFIYVKKKCKTCNLIKPARSKHCSFCNKCVARFDHHCPWLNTCVGEENYKHFLGFLFSTIAYLFYATYVLTGIVFARLDYFGLLANDFLTSTRTNRQIKVTNLVMLKYSMVQLPVIVALDFLCGVMAVVLCAFLGYHVYLIVIGKTTNETVKWDSVKRHYRSKDRIVRRCREEIMRLEDDGVDVRYLEQKDLLNPDVAPTLGRRMAVEFPETQPTNQYNFGFKGNWLRVIFPIMYQVRPKREAVQVTAGSKKKKRKNKTSKKNR